MDYIGPMPVSEGCKYAFTWMDTSLGLLQEFPCKLVTGEAIIKGFTKLRDMNGYSEN